MYWRVREGLHGLLGKIRPRGTSLIIEDVCVPPARIAEAAAEIRALLGQHGFLPGVAGHASAGNLHFMLTPAFGEQADRDRYEAFMGDLVALIVDKYDGSLKAEHGTGLNMAPWVEREWGAEGDRDDVAHQGARRPGRRARAGRAPEPRSRRAPAQPEDGAADRGGGGQLRGVRVLRAGVPEPLADHDATPAHRAAPRDGAPAAPGRRCCARCSTSTSTTGSRRARRTARACSRARSGSTPASS